MLSHCKSCTHRSITTTHTAWTKIRRMSTGFFLDRIYLYDFLPNTPEAQQLPQISSLLSAVLHGGDLSHGSQLTSVGPTTAVETMSFDQPSRWRRFLGRSPLSCIVGLRFSTHEPIEPLLAHFHDKMNDSTARLVQIKENDGNLLSSSQRDVTSAFVLETSQTAKALSSWRFIRDETFTQNPMLIFAQKPQGSPSTSPITSSNEADIDAGIKEVVFASHAPNDLIPSLSTLLGPGQGVFPLAKLPVLRVVKSYRTRINTLVFHSTPLAKLDSDSKTVANAPDIIAERLKDLNLLQGSTWTHSTASLAAFRGLEIRTTRGNDISPFYSEIEYHPVDFDSQAQYMNKGLSCVGATGLMFRAQVKHALKPNSAKTLESS
eukprot:TRINITY_DN3168_c0_g1_i1.p1 TRINITY_DN3168_c0_g1~~TRINITY_DN3168_c0_g1_i1.p1  ORF type:complete len:376 (-),score=76.19 TRINITY_DN3168_c0_g1_i1:277-1404(-)